MTLSRELRAFASTVVPALTMFMQGGRKALTPQEEGVQTTLLLSPPISAALGLDRAQCVLHAAFI